MLRGGVRSLSSFLFLFLLSSGASREKEERIKNKEKENRRLRVTSLMLRGGQFWQGGLAETAVVCLVVLAAVSA
ncbi:MAG: hypothetical protein LBC18_12060, partial [Opitutaceae bacterium]|nr:hypothetical protein [Opitutaceae bacterium]